MRVAWVFTGLPRFTVEGHPSLKRLMDQYDSTSFAHFWTGDEVGSKSYRTLEDETRYYDQEIEDFQKIYRPKSIAVEPCQMAWLTNPADHVGLTEQSMTLLNSTVNANRRLFDGRGTAFTRPARSYFLFRSMQAGLNLVDDEFDIVVKCRTDLNIKKKGFGELVMGLPEVERILYTVGSVASSSVENKFKVNDMLLYAKQPTMMVVKDLIDDYWDLARVGQATYNPKYEGQYPMTFEAHTLLYNYLQFKGIQVFTMGGDTRRFCWRFQ